MNNVDKHHHVDCESCYSEKPEPLTDVTNAQYASLFFADGERSIDFVIVWRTVEDPVEENLNQVKRAIFEDNLINEGLELERESIEQIHFTKIHTPLEVLRRYSEILKLRMPMKEVNWSHFFFFFANIQSTHTIQPTPTIYFQSLSLVQEQCRLSRLSNAAIFITNKVRNCTQKSRVIFRLVCCLYCF